MYPGFFKGMSSGKGGSTKEQKSQHKQSNRNSNASDTSLPNEEFIDLKNSLVQFKKSLKHFSRVIFYASTCSQSSGLKRIHVGLGEVLDNLKIILEKHPSLATPEVFSSVQMLISYVQSRQNSKICVVEGDRLINQLALYFTKSASQYVLQMRDLKSSDKIQGLKALKNSSSIFGIELEKHVNASKSDVPFIVTKCIKEVETHGLYLKGIYRVSAVKSKVHQLCEAFEKHGNSVNLIDINPNIIANVLKLYLRELPQPLFTFELYPEFIRVAKMYEADSSEQNKTHCIEELRKILTKLPKPYYAAASIVMQHLHKISNESPVNNMSAYNLAVIFGPTLLHCLNDTIESTPGAVLFDSIHQIRAIELMITWADTLFASN